jgi:hypothetical protein
MAGQIKTDRRVGKNQKVHEVTKGVAIHTSVMKQQDWLSLLEAWRRTRKSCVSTVVHEGSDPVYIEVLVWHVANGTGTITVYGAKT